MAQTDFAPQGISVRDDEAGDPPGISAFGTAPDVRGPEEMARAAHRAEARMLADLEADLSERERGQAEAAAAKETARLMGMQLVRGIQKRSGMTLEELSRRSGVAVGTISRLATGSRDTGPALWTLIALSEAGDVPLSVTLPQG
ncbi:MAG: XRE family transcriptional regulator [Rhodobacteraceae bacterium]|jgi:hypothetical protein|uniref:Helix-turn-helix protein n=1 Tax=Salipiger profundus TaxID=1229727 RepID=A0A1U7CZW4_9RHOB|nr:MULTISPECIES: helix-turn-helix transcriptional regulator [Salipiger]APX21383.1 Helix-turn-helix protein [Salipiger profundus]MAB08793.1 XRE family transcriptional regulator [Paracoccaceae bacterium]GGA02757.1 hypothetical protein GCM10011326_12680 [Salipiger profundus]SFC23196.1 Helix-turn-helix [Salipiger profundus]